MRIHIERIDNHAAHCANVAAFCLEWPHRNMASDGFVLRFAGWFITREKKVARISVDWAGEPVDSFAPVSRPDVVTAYPESSPELVGGFEATVPVYGMFGKESLTIMLHFADQAQCAATVVITLSPMQVSYRCRRLPILVTSSGRTGSTLAMALLAGHPGILCASPFPFEHKSALYWAHAALTLSSSADRRRSLANGEFEANRFSLGFNPYLGIMPNRSPEACRWANVTLPGLMANHFLAVIDSYYQAVALDRAKPEATHFVEKAFHRILQPVVRELYADSKEIFVVRDPRDVYVSTCQFHKKWGYKMYADNDGFGNELDHIKYLGARLKHVMRDWQARQTTSLLMKYEDLVGAPLDATRAMFQYVGVAADEKVVGTAVESAFASSKQVKDHATSESPAQSVGRWRHELSAPLAEACNSAFRPFLDVFGYDRE